MCESDVVRTLLEDPAVFEMDWRGAEKQLASS